MAFLPDTLTPRALLLVTQSPILWTFAFLTVKHHFKSLQPHPLLIFMSYSAIAHVRQPKKPQNQHPTLHPSVALRTENSSSNRHLHLQSRKQPLLSGEGISLISMFGNHSVSAWQNLIQCYPFVSNSYYQLSDTTCSASNVVTLSYVLDACLPSGDEYRRRSLSGDPWIWEYFCSSCLVSAVSVLQSILNHTYEALYLLRRVDDQYRIFR